MRNKQISRSGYSRSRLSKEPVKKRHFVLIDVVIIGLVLFFSVGAVAYGVNTVHNRTKPKSTPVAKAPVNVCANNNLAQLTIVSISQRHMWACDLTTNVYSTPVITGMTQHAADLTPTGTYHVYAKERDQHLIGSDSTGSWNDFVYYWMPFLNNQYGTYGFHDATWRSANDFGNIDPSSDNASHGCVEMPLAAAAWLYNWATVGMTVTIQA